MDQLSFKQKLWLPLVCSLLCICTIFVYQTWQMRALRIEERSNDLRHLDEVALSIVKQFGDKAAAGTLGKEEAQPQAIAVLRGLRDGQDGYFTISSGTRAVMHATKPQNENKDWAELKDPKGLYVYREIAATGALPEAGATMDQVVASVARFRLGGYLASTGTVSTTAAS